MCINKYIKKFTKKALKKDKKMRHSIYKRNKMHGVTHMQIITLEGIANICEELPEEMQKYGFS